MQMKKGKKYTTANGQLHTALSFYGESGVQYDSFLDARRSNGGHIVVMDNNGNRHSVNDVKFL